MSQQSKTEWLADRKQGVTASEAAAILGINENYGYADQSALTIWQDKTSDNIEEKECAIFDAGAALEPVAAREYQRQHPDHEVVDFGRHHILRHPKIPWLSCTLDRLVKAEGIDKPMEIKCVGLGQYQKSSDWKEDPPLKNQIQLQLQMQILGAPSGILAGFFVLGCNLVTVDFERDNELFSLILPRLEKFRQCVLDRVEPDPYDFYIGLDAVKKYYKTVNRETIEMDTRALELVLDWRSKKYELSVIKKETAELEAKVRALMGKNCFARLPDGSKLERETIQRKGFTTEPSEYVTLSWKK